MMESNLTDAEKSAETKLQTGDLVIWNWISVVLETDLFPGDIQYCNSN